MMLPPTVNLSARLCADLFTHVSLETHKIKSEACRARAK